MRKLVPLVLVFVLLLVATAVVSADPPPGVAPAFRLDPWGECSVAADDNGWEYVGNVVLQYSNGATGHATWKCRLELFSGPPQYLDFGYPSTLCNGYLTIELDGYKGMATLQCFGEWYP